MTTLPPTRTTDAATREGSRLRRLVRIVIGVLLTDPDRRVSPPRPKSPRPLLLLLAALVLAFLITTIVVGVIELDPTMTPAPERPDQDRIVPVLGPPVPQFALFASAGACVLAFFRPLVAWRLATFMMICWMLIFQQVLGDLWPFWAHYLLILFLVPARHVRWISALTTFAGLAALLVALPLVADSPFDVPPIGVLLFSAFAAILLGRTVGGGYETWLLRRRPRPAEDEAERSQREERDRFLEETGRNLRDEARATGALSLVVLITGTDSALAPRRMASTRWRRRLIVVLVVLIAIVTTVVGLVGSVNQPGWADFLVLTSGVICLLALPLPLLAWRLSLPGIVTAFAALPEYVGQMLGLWLIVMVTLFLVSYRHTSRITILSGR